MQNETVAKAFEDAMDTADCETLIGHVQTWFDAPYRSPENALGIIPCIASAIDTALTKKEDDARRSWRTVEADHWKAARQTIDAGIRRLVETIGRQSAPEPNDQPRHDVQHAGGWRQGAPAAGRGSWGQAVPSTAASRPAIGAGWGPPRTT